MKLWSVVVLLSLGCVSFAQDILKPQLIRAVAVGKSPGELGFNLELEGGIFPSPHTWFFTREGFIAVLDAANRKITLFDPEIMAFKAEIESDYGRSNSLFGVLSMQQENGYSWGQTSVSAILFDDKMKILQRVPELGQTFFRQGILWNYRSDGLVEGYDLQGRLLEGNTAQDLLKNLNARVYSGTAYSAPINDSIRRMIESGRYLIIDGKILPRSFQQAKEFYDLFVGTRWRDSSKDVRGIAPFSVMGGYYENWSLPDDGTSYWEFSGNVPHTTYVGVLSPFGDLIAYFSFGNIQPRLIRQQMIAEKQKPGFGEYEYNSPRMLISPKGDVYFMVGYPKEIKFYRVTRTW